MAVRNKMNTKPIAAFKDDDKLLAHITTDKPFYKANEVVFIEVFVVDSLNKTPKFTEVPKPIYNSRTKRSYMPYVPKISSKASILDSFGT